MVCEAQGVLASRRAPAGFSLIEIVVVVAIVGILAALAISAYARYAYRAHRVDGQGLLLRIADAEERYYWGNNRYGSLAQIGYADPAISEQRFYLATVALSNAAAEGSPQAFTASASPVGVQLRDACDALAIDNTGVKTPAASSPMFAVNGACW